MFSFYSAAMRAVPAVATAMLLTGMSGAQAQTQPSVAAGQPPAPQRADPADPGALTPALVYRSAISRYKPFAEPDVAPWRETNDRVYQRGGWRAYAREGQEPADTQAKPDTPAKPDAQAMPGMPAMPSHSGHEMKMK
jgi:hypothetical protein